MTGGAKPITLAHGNGGVLTRALTEEFASHLGDAAPDLDCDAAVVGAVDGGIVLTSDGFTVDPLIFPGGDIGSLAGHGTVNDLAVTGAIPRFMTLSLFLEEGLDRALLTRVARSIGAAARECRLRIAAGDTKVVPRGHGGGIYIATSGLGVRHPDVDLHVGKIQNGDRIVVSGPIGDHGTAVLLAREDFGLSGDLQSDCGSVLDLAATACRVDGLRFMRDPTRGGLATVANEIASDTGFRVTLHEARIPVRDPVQAVCEALGLDAYTLACEGRVVAVAEQGASETICEEWRRVPGGKDASIVGSVDDGAPHVVLRTRYGGERILDPLEDDPLPRIC